MNPVTGGVGASYGTDGSGDGDADQFDGGGLQQVQVFPGGGLGVAAVATISTTATISSVVTTYAPVTTVVATSTGSITSTGATTSVGKGSSGGRSDKGKGPVSKRYAVGSTVSAAAVHTTPVGASPELVYPTSSRTSADPTSSQTMECCGFHFCAQDWLKLRKSEDGFLFIVGEVATSIFRSRLGKFSFSRGASVVEGISRLRGELFSDVEVDVRDFSEEYFEDVCSKVASSSHILGGAVTKFSSEEVCRFRGLFFTAMLAKVRECLALTWNSEVSRALDRALGASAAPATSRSRANFSARARANVNASARARAAVVRVAAAAPATDPAVRVAAAAATPATGPDLGLDLVLADIRGCAADPIDSSALVVTTATVATAPAIATAPSTARIRVPSTARARATTATATVTTAGPSASLLLPASSHIDPGFVDLFGFRVLPEVSELVNKLVSEMCALAKGAYPYTMRTPVSDTLCWFSSSGKKRAWCLMSMKLYETKFAAKCYVAYCAKLIPEFIVSICSVRAWDSSSRCLSPLVGNRLRDFWASLDQAVLKAVGDFFVAKWAALTMRFSVPFFFPLGPEEGSSALCGGDFVDACASTRSGASSLSGSRFASIIGRVEVQVVRGDCVDLFGFEVLPEVREIFDVLICEISALARLTYSSVVRDQVLDAMSRLPDSEQCAWLTANMMLYKTGFMAKCFTNYHSGLCPDFIRSLFSVRVGGDSGCSLLSLTGNSLRNFWLSLNDAITESVEAVFLAEWGKFTGRFFVPLEPEEESSSTALCGRDFINALDRAGLPALAISGMRGRVARRAVPHVAEVASGSSAAGSSSMADSSSASVVDVISVAVSTVASGGSVSASSVEVKESPAITRRGPISVPKKSFMSRYSAGGGASFSGMTSSVSSSSSVAAGSLSSVSAMVGASSLVTTTTAAAATAYTYSGEEDVGVRLAALMNRGLPPSPTPASESTLTEGKASSSNRESGIGKRKRKKKS
ncbi:hypothetical protein [Candidatus Ichthyocystis sparus]|uniref:hypothetical protein n=2 Tax=Candidatus Ichthyocystis sparus TaxID=1561004 RepID=UPI00159ED586|nr:hypothetical protein [Candidatus Ichthyocystis sparus]